MNHYDALGVHVGAEAATIRQAYLRLAREHHPDFHSGSEECVRAAHAKQMQVINDAWAVLGNAVTRERYDLSLREPPPVSVPPPVERIRPQRDPKPPPGKSWTPRRGDDGWQRDYRSWVEEDERLAPDEPAGRPHRGLVVVVPVALFALAVIGAFLGLVFTSRPLIAGGFVAGAVSAALFLVLPIYEMSRSRHRG